MATKSSAKSREVWSDVEREAMQASARERKARARLGPEDERAAGEAEVRAKFAEMDPAERLIAERIHEIVAATAPDLVPRTYYGMPAYARAGKVICFFQPASKFNVRYNTFGFQPDAKLDDGDMWPNAYAVTKLTPTVEATITELVKRAAG